MGNSKNERQSIRKYNNSFNVRDIQNAFKCACSKLYEIADGAIKNNQTLEVPGVGILVAQMLNCRMVIENTVDVRIELPNYKLDINRAMGHYNKYIACYDGIGNGYDDLFKFHNFKVAFSDIGVLPYDDVLSMDAMRFLVCDDRLFSHVYFNSASLFGDLGYDLFSMASFHNMVAKKLGLMPDIMAFDIGNLWLDMVGFNKLKIMGYEKLKDEAINCSWEKYKNYIYSNYYD